MSLPCQPGILASEWDQCQVGYPTHGNARTHRYRIGGFRAINAYLQENTAEGRSILRDLVNATVGFEGLAAGLGRHLSDAEPESRCRERA
jgi:hypothetical protein